VTDVDYDDDADDDESGLEKSVTLVETPREGCMEGASQEFSYHFGAVFKLKLTEENCVNLLSKNNKNTIARGGN